MVIIWYCRLVQAFLCQFDDLCLGRPLLISLLCTFLLSRSEAVTLVSSTARLQDYHEWNKSSVTPAILAEYAPRGLSKSFSANVAAHRLIVHAPIRSARDPDCRAVPAEHSPEILALPRSPNSLGNVRIHV